MPAYVQNNFEGKVAIFNKNVQTMSYVLSRCTNDCSSIEITRVEINDERDLKYNNPHIMDITSPLNYAYILFTRRLVGSTDQAYSSGF